MSLNTLKTAGHFLPGFFQIAYVTNDLQRAIETFGEQFGVKQFFQMPNVQYDERSHISIATAYLGEVMIEIIQPHGPGSTIYDGVLPQDGSFAIRQHHIGHLFDDEAEYQRVVDQATAKHPVAYQGEVDGVIKAVYVDTCDVLGHYLEYVYCTPTGMAFLNQAPRN